MGGTTRRVESQESQKNGDAATKLATPTLSNLNTSLEEKLKPSPPVATVSVLESKPLPPKSEASKLSPLKSPKTNNKESPRASRSDDVSVERKSSGSSSASVTRSAYAKKTSTKATESTSEAAKEQSNLKKPSMDTSLEEAKRNAAAALSRPARLGNTNKLVDLNNYVAPKATPAKDKSKKGDKKMSVDPPRKSLLPPWGRKHVPQSSRSPSNDTSGINNKKQQHQQQNISSASGSLRGFAPPGFENAKGSFQ